MFFSNPLVVLTFVILGVMVVHAVTAFAPKNAATGDHQRPLDTSLIVALKVRMFSLYAIGLAAMIAFLDAFWSSVLILSAGTVHASAIAYFHWAIRTLDRDKR